MKVFLSFPNDPSREVEGPFESFPALFRRYEELKVEGVTLINAVRADIVCDLCSHPRVTWRYSITSGGVIYSYSNSGVEETHIDNDGQWACCEECKTLISERDWIGLADRAYDEGIRQAPQLASMPREIMHDVFAQGGHAVFRAGWECAGCPDPKRELTDEEIMLQGFRDEG